MIYNMSIEQEIRAPVVSILRPKISPENEPQFQVRYMNLANRLGEFGVQVLFADTHTSYDLTTHRFVGQQTIRRVVVSEAMQPVVVRDLTMPAEPQPLYADPNAPKIVHHPAFNDLLSRKDEIYKILPEIHPITFTADAGEIDEAAAAIPGYKVILKPVRGAGGKNVRVVRKKDLSLVEVEGKYLVQEFIDTSGGDPKLGIKGTHNLRLISIDSKVLGAVARVGGKRKTILLADGHGEVFEPEKLPDDVHTIAETIHKKLKELPGEGKNVIGIDLMYGKRKGGEQGYITCEINRRPVRISPWDLRREDTQDPAGMLWLGYEWDEHEARMLADLAINEV